MELLVRVVHRFVAPVEHVVVQHAVGLGIHAGGQAEVIDERLRGERAAYVRRRGGRVPEPGHVRRRVGLDVVGPEPVERHDHHRRVPRDRGRQNARERRRRRYRLGRHRRRPEERRSTGTSDDGDSVTGNTGRLRLPVIAGRV